MPDPALDLDLDLYVLLFQYSLPGWLPFCGVLPDLGRSKRG
jgi:hypothetical protein